MTKKLLSFNGNLKLNKNVAIFNLPTGTTCPGKTKICDRICYAKKAERQYPKTLSKRKWNYQQSLGQNFVNQVVAELKACPRIKQMRWHESGDIYNQDYLDKMFAVCTQCPETTFLAYTKSFHLDFSHKPANLVVYWSVDSSTIKTVPEGNVATLVLKGEDIPSTATTCDHTLVHHYCGIECQKCWKGTPEIYFDQH